MVARFDHQLAAFLHHVERVSHRFAGFHADERTIFARRNVAAIRAVFMEQMTHHAHAASLIHEIRFKTNQAACRNEGFDAH